MGKIHLQVEQGRNLAQKMNRAAGELFDSASMLKSQVGRLSGAWRGGGAEDFIRRARSCTNALENYANQFERLGVSLGSEVDQWVMADADGVGRIGSTNLGLMIGTGSAAAIAGGGIILFGPGGRSTGGGGGGGVWEGVKTIDGHTEYFLRNGRETEIYAGYLEGDMTFDEMMAYLSEDPLKKEIVKGKITFWKSEEAAARAAVWDGQAATGIGTFGASALAAEAASSGSVEYKDGDLQAKGGFEAGAYAAKGTYDAQAGALGVAAVGYIGANVQGEGGIAVNPLEGDLGVNAELEAFVGAKLEGEAELSGEVAGVDVSGGVSGGISYGLGATAKADVGMDDWNFCVDLELGATVGLGAEVGVNFEVNVQEAATSVVDFGKQAVDVFF